MFSFRITFTFFIYRMCLGVPLSLLTLCLCKFIDSFILKILSYTIDTSLNSASKNVNVY